MIATLCTLYIFTISARSGLIDNDAERYCIYIYIYMGARRNFSRGGGGNALGGGAQKSVKGGPHIFRQALYAYRGGGVVLKPAEFFLGGPKSIKVDLQNL